MLHLRKFLKDERGWKSSVNDNLPTAAVFLLGLGIAFSIVLFLPGVYCQALDKYTPLGWIQIMMGLIKMAGIFLLGILLFFFLKNRIPSKHYRYFKLLYFAILPFCMNYKQLLAIPTDFKYQQIERSICTKSTVHGLTVKSEHINKQEYDYLWENFYRLPQLPSSSDNIDIEYYADDFLGDFNLDINFDCNMDEKISTSSHWSVTEEDPAKKKKKVAYSNYRN